MAARVVVTARCPAKGHRLAELLATSGGLRVRVPHIAVGARNGRNRRGGAFEEPLDRTMSYNTVCGCGHGHPVSGDNLARAFESGESVLIARAIL